MSRRGRDAGREQARRFFAALQIGAYHHHKTQRLEGPAPQFRVGEAEVEYKPHSAIAVSVKPILSYVTAEEARGRAVREAQAAGGEAPVVALGEAKGVAAAAAEVEAIHAREAAQEVVCMPIEMAGIECLHVPRPAGGVGAMTPDIVNRYGFADDPRNRHLLIKLDLYTRASKAGLQDFIINRSGLQAVQSLLLSRYRTHLQKGDEVGAGIEATLQNYLEHGNCSKHLLQSVFGERRTHRREAMALIKDLDPLFGPDSLEFWGLHQKIERVCRELCHAIIASFLTHKISPTEGDWMVATTAAINANAVEIVPAHLEDYRVSAHAFEVMADQVDRVPADQYGAYARHLAAILAVFCVKRDEALITGAVPAVRRRIAVGAALEESRAALGGDDRHGSGEAAPAPAAAAAGGGGGALPGHRPGCR